MGGDLPPSTVARHYACLRAICAHAEASEMILRSPCRGIRLPRVHLVERPTLTPKNLDLLADKSEAGKRTIACPAWLTNDLAALLARRRPTAADGNPSYS